MDVLIPPAVCTASAAFPSLGVDEKGKAVKYLLSGAADHSDAAYGVKHTAINIYSVKPWKRF